MFSFNSNFWMQLGMNKDNPFDKHFEKPDLLLTDLLDDDAIIGELRNQHQKLMDFMQLPQVLELISYITEMPSEDSNSKRQFRYPYYASELLCCQTSKVDDLIFSEDKTAFNSMLQFIQQPGEVNPVLAGYVGKVLTTLAKQKTQAFFSICFANQDFLSSLIRQLQSRSMADIIIKLISLEPGKDLQEGIYIAERCQLVKSLLDKLDYQHDFEVPSNICQIVQEILQQAYVIPDVQPILNVLIQEYLPKLCSVAINENCYVSLAAGNIINAILTLVLKNKQRVQDQDEVVFNLEVESTLKPLEDALPQWIEFIKANPQQKLGQHKLKLVETVCYGVNLMSETYVNALAQQDIFNLFNYILISYDKNNIFQLIYLRFFTYIVEQKYDSLIRNLFEQNRFITLLLTITSESNLQQKKGYFGVVLKVSKFLEEQSPKDASISFYISSEEWKQFRVQYFEKVLQDSEHELGGLNKKSEKNDEENGSPLESPQITTEAEQIKNIFDQFNNLSVDQQQFAEINWENNNWSTTTTKQQSSWDNQNEKQNETIDLQQKMSSEDQKQEIQSFVSPQQSKESSGETAPQSEQESKEQQPSESAQQQPTQEPVSQSDQLSPEISKEYNVELQLVVQIQDAGQAKPQSEQIQESHMSQEGEKHEQQDMEDEQSKGENHFWQIDPQQNQQQVKDAVEEFSHNSQ